MERDTQIQETEKNAESAAAAVSQKQKHCGTGNLYATAVGSTSNDVCAGRGLLLFGCLAGGVANVVMRTWWIHASLVFWWLALDVSARPAQCEYRTVTTLASTPLQQHLRYVESGYALADLLTGNILQA